jgi:hypothetical protein
MARLALALGFAALVAAAVPSPGLFLAIGLGTAAIGVGWLGYRRREDRGSMRLVGAAAIAVGAAGCLLGALRVVLVLAAIDHLTRVVG